MATLSLIFVDELPEAASIALLVIIIVINAIFFISWFLMLVKEYKKQFMKKSTEGEDGSKSGFLNNILNKFRKNNKKQLAVEKSDHLEVQTFVGEPAIGEPVGEPVNQDQVFKFGIPRPSVIGVQPDKDELKEV